MPQGDEPSVLVVNGSSRRGRQWFPHVREQLEALGVPLCRAVLTRKPGEVEGIVRESVDAGVARVIVGGGDGTFTRVVRHLVDRETVLGVLPFGTGNAFARDLGIPNGVEPACEVLAKGRVGRVDLGTAGDDYFLNITTVGLTTRIAEGLTAEQKRRFGRAVYLTALLRALLLVRPFHASVDCAEGHFEFDAMQVVIGNGRFHAGPFLLSPDASITEGRLTLYAVQGRSKWHFLKLALYLRSGRHVDLDEVFHLSTVGGVLNTTPSKRVTVDGEILFRTPLRFGVHPDCLKVNVPGTFFDPSKGSA